MTAGIHTHTLKNLNKSTGLVEHMPLRSKFTWLCLPRKLAALLLDGEEPSMPEA